jgi:hypothetical protein
VAGLDGGELSFGPQDAMVKEWWKVSADDGYRESRHAKYLSSAADMMMSTGRIMLQSIRQAYPVRGVFTRRFW